MDCSDNPALQYLDLRFDVWGGVGAYDPCAREVWLGLFVRRQDRTISTPVYCARVHASLSAAQHGWWGTRSENCEKRRKEKVTQLFLSH